MNTPTLPLRLSQSTTNKSELCAAELTLQETKSNDSPSTDSVVELMSDDNNSFTQLVSKLSHTEQQDTIFTKNGYIKMNKICDTLQGELFKAKRISNNQFVVIKRTDKLQFNDKISIQNEATFCVSENIIKEALILKYLTVDNKCMVDHIVQFIDFFRSDTDYYLVMEYIESEMNLKQFVLSAHQYIKNGKLKLKEYKKVIKYIHWQIAFILYWLHNDMKCCHLDLCVENIMVKDCNFIQETDGYFIINPNISIKLIDFGVSEVFHSFHCRKQGLSIDDELYLAPKIHSDEIYDARLADMWSFGMILYFCMTGKPLYKPMEIWQSVSIHIDASINGYLAVYEGKLKQYISTINKPLKVFNSISFSLLNNLLNIDENKRLNAKNVLKHKWFESYYKKYSKRMKKHSILQKQKILKQQTMKNNFPFYKSTEYNH